MQSTSSIPAEIAKQLPPWASLYSFRHWRLSAAKRLALVQIALALATAGGLLLSRKLWLTTRDFPLAPVATWLPTIGPPWDHVWWVALLILLVAMALLPRSPWPARLFLLLMLPLAALDQTRWQPWVYQYLVMMAILALRSLTAVSPSTSEDAPLNACRLIIVMTYVWGGLQKCNASFVNDLAPWLLRPLRDSLAVHTAAWPPPAGLLNSAMALTIDHSLVLAILEICIGLGLLIPGVRRAAVVLSVGMHVLILFVFGPLGHNSNTVIWPWNAAMIALVLILFVGQRASPSSVFNPRRSLGHWLALVLFGLLPILNFFDRWDSYLSLALYSGNTLQADVELHRKLFNDLPPTVRKHGWHIAGPYYWLELSKWSLEELNVPPYPARRVYQSIASQLGARAERPDDCILVLQERPPLTRTERRTTFLNCGP